MPPLAADQFVHLSGLKIWRRFTVIRRCTERRVLARFDVLKTQLPSRALGQCRRIARSFSKRLPVLASKPNWENRLRREVRSEIRQPGIQISFANMAIEDAIILMFMLMAEDAQKDLKDMLDDMKTTQKQKQAMRELANQMRKEICRLMDQRESTAPRA